MLFESITKIPGLFVGPTSEEDCRGRRQLGGLARFSALSACGGHYLQIKLPDC